MLAATPLLAAGRTGAHSPARIAQSQAEKLEVSITATMQTLSIPGAIVLVDQAGADVWTAAFGISDIDTGAPMTSEMHMRIGSVTKTMTATVILQLIDEGALALDDNLATVLPDLANAPHARHITVRHLLSMTSGVFDLLDDEAVFGEILENPARTWTPEELVEIAFANEPAFAPGEDIAYSNTNYMLLGMLVEQVTGQSAADAFHVRLFEPLGMTHTSLPATADLPKPFARGYSVDLSGQTEHLIDWTGLNPTVAWTGGGVVSTVGDLHVWMQALVDGSLISKPLQRERMSFTTIRPGYSYGLGIANYDGMIGHEGSILGYHSFAGHDTETGDTVIVLANLDPAGGDQDAATAIAEAILEELAL
ncbi:MAG TPA: serine hydrolase domain-containing protein [Thermomicrobiales bacterium]|nr:serine hydrolase domain-containing protein [Thermomicrobiales bacterium]